jgi:hypothetical protein
MSLILFFPPLLTPPFPLSALLSLFLFSIILFIIPWCLISRCLKSTLEGSRCGRCIQPSPPSVSPAIPARVLLILLRLRLLILVLPHIHIHTRSHIPIIHPSLCNLTPRSALIPILLTPMTALLALILLLVFPVPVLSALFPWPLWLRTAQFTVSSPAQ